MSSILSTALIEIKIFHSLKRKVYCLINEAIVSGQILLTFGSHKFLRDSSDINYILNTNSFFQMYSLFQMKIIILLKYT